MAHTPSTMLALGTPAPDFALTDTDGSTVSLGHYTGKPLLVMFICNHCPFVIHVAPELARLAADYGDQVGIVAVQSNDVANYPADAPDKMAEEKTKRGYTFPYLYDADQSVAKAYTAACTPDFFLFDAEHKLAYRGQLDSTRPYRISSGNYDDRNGAANGEDMRAALDALLAGKPMPEQQWPSIGCNIKWIAGNEPAYFG
ncbi:thioredoxin family protein [Algisphaera agarilytica]|uniref:Peroxiredoxin n=1 Tax=Algisphaera agarilytica TaxID=1385975 RepID=A0A7X0LKA6_9BACT|nr:thioredoxin family protein [Algisphaera agarilytica]MBB6429644.1 peroxiredoxin [Algisphaera agarilytica]